MVIPPECLWRPRGVYFGFAEVRAAQQLKDHLSQKQLSRISKSLNRTYWGRANIIYFLMAQGIEEIYRMWTNHFAAGKQVYDINIGFNPFIVNDQNISALLKAVYEFEQQEK